MPKATRYNEPFQIWFFSVVSVVLGCLLVYLTSLEYAFAWPLIGFAHLFVFLPAMLLSEQRWYNIITASVICVLFPLWGVVIGLFTMGVGAPFTCSLAWGLVLMVALRRPNAFPVMLVVGLLSSVVLFTPGTSILRGDGEAGFIASITAWYALMGVAMPFIMHFPPSSPRPKYCGDDICHTCGYSLEGLASGAVCPECGQAREEPAASRSA